MKKLFSIALLIVCSFGFAQHQLSLDYQKSLNFGEVELKFEKVLHDSRCPKSVMCVRAGEAEVLVSIFKNGKFIKNKKMVTTFFGSKQKANLIISDNEYEIYGLALQPYPIKVDAIPPEDYILELMLIKKE